MAVQKSGRVHQKTYKIFEAIFRKIDFYQNFDYENFQSYFKYELLMILEFFWGAACLSSSKIDEPKFSPMIFLFLPSVSLATSWGQTNSFRNLTRVLNEA